jgi:hypothetical protein
MIPCFVFCLPLAQMVSYHNYQYGQPYGIAFSSWWVALWPVWVWIIAMHFHVAAACYHAFRFGWPKEIAHIFLFVSTWNEKQDAFSGIASVCDTSFCELM